MLFISQMKDDNVLVHKRSNRDMIRTSLESHARLIQTTERFERLCTSER